ncbi:MAG: hypothetical protein KGQ41_09895, partial [Alphaproteobacteria bacterium]|nr:hypothetical protein [Alphaproteobacteria bacterium]
YGEGLENQKLTNFDVDVGFDPKTQDLEINNTEITMKGITLKVSGHISAQQGWDKLSGNIKAQSPVIAVDALPAVWPAVWDVGARHWLVDRMDKGRVANLSVDVPFTATRTKLEPKPEATEDDPEYKWDIANGTIKANFDFTGVSINYREPMLPVQNATGIGTYEGLALTLDLAKANIGKLEVKKGSVHFDDLITPGTGKADLHLTLHGPVGSVFEYLEKEPISYRRKVDIDGSKGKGIADVELFTTFPTTKDMRVEDVKVKADAILRNLVMPAAVKGMTLAGDEFKLEASESHFKIDGKGTIEGRPATLVWAERFEPKAGDEYASSLEADISTDKPLRLHFIGEGLENRVDGIIPAKIKMLTLPDGKGTLDVMAQLSDARIDFTNPFNFVKEKGVKATATLTGTLQNNYLQSLDTLMVKGDGISLDGGKITFTRDSANAPVLSTASLKNLRMGATDASLDASWKNENDIKATVSGNSFDARYIMGNTKPAEGNEKPATAKTPMAYDVSIKTGKLYIADTPLENVSGAFVGNADGTVGKARVDATAGGTPAKLQYDAGGLLWQSDNAGAALSAFGVTDRVRGGKLSVAAKPLEKGNAGDMKGTVVIEDFSVVKAPTLAKLVNLLSVPGLLNILSQDTGLKFARAESDIVFLNRTTGPVIQFADGRTSGSSLGLTFEGEVDTGSDSIAI